jgi:hypothetical protein
MSGWPPPGGRGSASGLGDVLARIWAMLARGAGEPDAAFRTAVLGTVGDAGGALRTVILRFCDPRARVIACHTDRRSAKVAELARTASAEWLFFEPSARIQVRAAGPTRVEVDGELVERLWRAASPRIRLAYLGEEAPGTASAAPTTGIPAVYLERDPSPEESESGRHRFAVVRSRIERIDWVRLGDRSNHRARFLWRDEALDASWVSP